MIFATPNDQDCISQSFEKHPQHERDTSGKPQWWWDKYDAKNTEDCYNDTNVRILANWRSDQLKNDPNLVDPNLAYPDCGSQGLTKYPYNFYDEGELCKRLINETHQELHLPPKEAALPANLKGVQRLSDNNVRSYLVEKVVQFSFSSTVKFWATSKPSADHVAQAVKTQVIFQNILSILFFYISLQG